MHFFRPVLQLVTVIFLLLSHTSLFAGFSQTTSVGQLLGSNRILTGDLPDMVERRFIRVLIPYNKTFFFFDGAQPKGLSHDRAVEFGKFLNTRLKSKHIEVKMIFIPTPRAELFTKLSIGLGDIAMGNLTITEERLEAVDFSDPFMTDVREVLVTSKDREDLHRVFELSGRKIHARKSSSYYTSLLNLNGLLDAVGKPPVRIVAANEHLEDMDLMEMVNANLVPGMIVDDHKARFMTKIFNNIKVHEDVCVATGGSIGWAVRKGNPELKSLINDFVKKHKEGTLLGNMAVKRYLGDASYITDSIHGRNMKRFRAVVDYFKKYGDRYEFDYLMLTALAYQESQLDQNMKSRAGAIGIMQVLPSTARDKNVAVPNIEKLEPNIHAGTKYLRFLADRYFPEERGMDSLNRALFSFAAYNAGPGKISRLRKEAQENGLDPNLWFNNVEIVAARRIGRETVRYVSNIFKYYVAYKLQQDKMEPVL